MLDKDNNGYLALKNIADYSPSNPAYKLSAVSAAKQAVEDKHEAEKHAEDAAKAAQDASAAAEHAFHDMMQQVTNQVVSQYGDSSDELASLGLKKEKRIQAPLRAA